MEFRLDNRMITEEGNTRQRIRMPHTFPAYLCGTLNIPSPLWWAFPHQWGMPTNGEG
jgi:hypothetical protein